jgi:hypothetical protein
MAESETPPDQYESNTTSASNDPDSKGTPAQDDTTLPVTSDKPPSEKKETHKCRPDQTPALKQWVEVAAAVVGVCAVLFYAGQLNVMQQVATDTKNGVIEANKREVALDKPFVLPDLTLIQIPPSNEEAKDNYVIFQRWRNVGRSRAENVTAKWAWGRDGFTENAKFRTAFSKYPLPENATNGTIDYGLIPKAELERLSEDTELFIFGIETYENVFNPRQCYRGEYCLSLQRFNPKTLNVEITNCKTHNSYDEVKCPSESSK